jgi:hypothetical protein
MTAYDRDTAEWDSEEEVLHFIEPENIKKAVEERRQAFRKNLPSYLWTAVKDLFALVVILAIFRTASGSFQSVIFTLLVVIYISLEGLFSSYSYKTTQTVVGLADELYQTKKPPHHEKNEIEEKKRKDALAVYLKLEINFFIHSLFLFLAFLVVLANLLHSII